MSPLDLYPLAADEIESLLKGYHLTCGRLFHDPLEKISTLYPVYEGVLIFVE